VKTLILWILIIVLQVPLSSWKAMTENDRNRIRILIITEFCEMYAKQKGVSRFKVWEEIKDGMWKLQINSQPDVI